MPSRLVSFAHGLLVALAVFCLNVGPGFAQLDPQLRGGHPGTVPPEPVPVVIDTAQVVFEWPETDPVPGAVHTVQDTILFGDVFHLVLDYAPEAGEIPEVALAGGADWLVPEEKPEPDLTGLPKPEGTRVVHSWRVYRTGPFRVNTGSFTSPVIQVRGRIDGTGQVATIRAPRVVGWSPWVALGLLLALMVVILLGRWLWGQVQRREDPEDFQIPLPAWLPAVIELKKLLKDGTLNRGDSRSFLDGLAGISRRFVAGRYRVPAQEMTGREITRACAGLGYGSAAPGGFARLIDELDHRRYNPEAAAGGWCREQAIDLYRQIEAARILPVYCDVPADLLREGETAWAEVDRELSLGGRSLRTAAPASGGGPA
jgi:hypothetical protein